MKTLSKAQIIELIAKKDSKGNYHSLQCNSESFFLNGKRIKLSKLLSKIQNNHPDNAIYSIRKAVRAIKRYKGDFEYFQNAYNKGKCALALYKSITYVSVSWS